MDKFDIYLKNKRVNAEKFRVTLPGEAAKLRAEFLAGGERAFELRKKFLLNSLRLEFPVADE